MNIEPLLFAILLWRWRAWPVGLGITAAVAMKNREFTIYALAALVTLDLIRYAIDRIPALARWRESPLRRRQPSTGRDSGADARSPPSVSRSRGRRLAR